MIMDAFYFKLLARSQGNLSGVHEDLRALYSLMVERCPDGLFPCVVEGVRTKERQAELRRAGLSWVRQSLHQTGRAIDVVLFKVSEAGIQATYDPADYGRFATACRLPRSVAGLVWGGNWKQRDYLHWEIPVVPIGQVPPEGGEGGAKP